MPSFPDLYVPKFGTLKIAGIILSVLFIIPFIFYFLPTERSFVVSVETLGFEIETFGESKNSWQLPSGTVCLREKELNLLDNNFSEKQLCKKHKLSNMEFSWPEGTLLKIRKGYNEGSPVKIQVSNYNKKEAEINGMTLTQHSFIELTNEEWQMNGSLIFNGLTTIGKEPSPGSSSHLISGNYSIYEKLFLRNVPLKVDTGNFNTGDEISVHSTSGKKNVVMSGFISSNKQGMKIISYSPLSDSFLKVKHLGSEDTLISSTWYKRALNDPFLIAVTALLAILVGLVELISFSRNKD